MKDMHACVYEVGGMAYVLFRDGLVLLNMGFCGWTKRLVKEVSATQWLNLSGRLVHIDVKRSTAWEASRRLNEVYVGAEDECDGWLAAQCSG